MGDSSETKRTKLTNQSNEKVAQMNIDYQKEYNAQVFNREDTANQRAVADMRAAGLNPLANYSPSGSGGVSSAPQSNMHYESGNSKLMENLQALQAGTSIAESLQNQALGLQQMQQNSAALEGQKLLNQSQSYANMYDRMSLTDRVLADKYNSASIQNAYKRAEYDYNYRRYYGIHEGDDKDTIQAKIIARSLVDSGYSDDSGFVSGHLLDDGSPIQYSLGSTRDDLSKAHLLNSVSASYGQVSDKVMSIVNSILSKSDKISNKYNNSTHNDHGNKKYQ